MKRVFAVFLILFASSTAAYTEFPQPNTPHIGGNLQSTSPLQANTPPPPAEEPPMNVGGSVKPPVLLKQVEAKFTKAARKAKVDGVVVVGLIVETDGTPSHVHVTKSLGYGLDESAAEAITQYRFRPSTANGKPVRVQMNVEVHFKIFKGPFRF